MDLLENLLNWSKFLGDSNNENIGYFFVEVGLFLVCEHNYNCVLQKFFDGIVIGLYV